MLDREGQLDRLATVRISRANPADAYPNGLSCNSHRDHSRLQRINNVPSVLPNTSL